MARNRIKKTTCPNCDFKFSGANNYCPNCGQENHTHKLPLKHFFSEFLETFMHFDGKTLSTLRDLLLKPGEITVNFNQNKRARYVPPLRIYIFVSFVFFFLLALMPAQMNFNRIDQESIDQIEDSSARSMIHKIKNSSGDSATSYIMNEINKSEKVTVTLMNIDLVSINKNSPWFEKMKMKIRELKQEEFRHKLYKNFSSLMFVLMPLFALFLKLIYRRKKLYYSEHLIFSLHFHSLVFLLFILWYLLDLLKLNPGFFVFIIMNIYLIFSMRRVYLQGWSKTLIKWFVLCSAYGISLILALVTGVIISVML